MGYNLKDNEYIFHLTPYNIMCAYWFGHNEVSKIMAPHGIGYFSSNRPYPSSLSLTKLAYIQKTVTALLVSLRSLNFSAILRNIFAFVFFVFLDHNKPGEEGKGGEKKTKNRPSSPSSPSSRPSCPLL